MDEKRIIQEIGREGLIKITSTFYQKIKLDALIGPMYPKDQWEASETRLREFLLMRIAGETDYIKHRGHPRLKMRHVPFAIGIKERDRWLQLMSESISENSIPEQSASELNKFFSEVADFMRNKHQ